MFHCCSRKNIFDEWWLMNVIWHSWAAIIDQSWYVFDSCEHYCVRWCCWQWCCHQHLKISWVRACWCDVHDTSEQWWYEKTSDTQCSIAAEKCCLRQLCQCADDRREDWAIIMTTMTAVTAMTMMMMTMILDEKRWFTVVVENSVRWWHQSLSVNTIMQTWQTETHKFQSDSSWVNE